MGKTSEEREWFGPRIREACEGWGQRHFEGKRSEECCLTSTGEIKRHVSAVPIDGQPKRRTFFDPFTTKLFPSALLLAVVFNPATSLPPLASVMPRQQRSFP